MIKLLDILKEITEGNFLDATGAEMDFNIFPQFTENGKYNTNSSQRILIINDTSNKPNIIAKDALNKWKEINNWLKQFSDGNKWRLRGISMGYVTPIAEQIAQELLKLYPSGEIKRWGKDEIRFAFPLLDITPSQQNEIQIQPKKIIGHGEQGNVYNVGSNKVVKRSTYRDGFTPDEIEIYNLFNQYPDIFPHIYKLTKNYVVMDKLDSPGKPLGDVYNFLDDIDPLSGGSMPWREEDFLQKIYRSLYNNNLEIFNSILQKAKKLNRMDIYDTLKKCLDFCIKLKELFQNKRIDVHLGNVGVDNDGKIKIFDASLE